jgi:hypothetical protein
LCPNKKSWAIEVEMQVGCTMMKARKIGMKGTHSQRIFVAKLGDNLLKCVIQLYLREIEYKIYTATT